MSTTYHIKHFVQFLATLEQNNNRLWFDVNRTQYKQLSEQFKVIAADILDKLTHIDPLLFGIDLKSSLYRINRDARFSHNKNPYNTHISALFSQTGKQDCCIGYYLQINQLGELIVGGGQYVLESTELFRIRTILSKDSSDLESIVNNELFQKTFGELTSQQLKTCPKGFAKDNPNIFWLRYKNYVASNNISCKDWSDQRISDFVLQHFEVIKPLISWLRNI